MLNHAITMFVFTVRKMFLYKCLHCSLELQSEPVTPQAPWSHFSLTLSWFLYVASFCLRWCVKSKQTRVIHMRKMRFEKQTCMPNHLKPLLRIFRRHGKMRWSLGTFMFIPFRVLHQNDEGKNGKLLHDKNTFTYRSLCCLWFSLL